MSLAMMSQHGAPAGAQHMASRVRVQELEARVEELTDVVRMLAAVVHDLAHRECPHLTTDAEKALKAAWAVGP